MIANIIVFPGSNCDRDIKVALEKFQIKCKMIWHKENELPKADLVVLPGGFLMEIILDVDRWHLNQS